MIIFSQQYFLQLIHSDVIDMLPRHLSFRCKNEDTPQPKWKYLLEQVINVLCTMFLIL